MPLKSDVVVNGGNRKIEETITDVHVESEAAGVQIYARNNATTTNRSLQLQKWGGDTVVSGRVKADGNSTVGVADPYVVMQDGSNYINKIASGLFLNTLKIPERVTQEDQLHFPNTGGATTDLYFKIDFTNFGTPSRNLIAEGRRKFTGIFELSSFQNGKINFQPGTTGGYPTLNLFALETNLKLNGTAPGTPSSTPQQTAGGDFSPEVQLTTSFQCVHYSFDTEISDFNGNGHVVDYKYLIDGDPQFGTGSMWMLDTVHTLTDLRFKFNYASTADIYRLYKITLLAQ